MVLIWDYSKKKLSSTDKGQQIILERMINNGVYLEDKEKLSKKTLKKFWNQLKIESDRRRYLHFLLWKN